MRPAMRTMLGVVLVTCGCGQIVAEETKSSWWPFGGKEETAAPAVTTALPATTQTAPAVEPESAISWPSMPTINWPSFALKDRDKDAAVVGEVPPSMATPAPPSATTVPPVAAAPSIAGAAAQPPITPVTEPEAKPRRTPRFGKAAQDPKRNSWAATEPKEPGPSPWESMKSGARRMSDSTVAAWHKTVDVVTPGDSDEVTTPSVSSPVAQQKPEKSWWNWWRSDETEPEGPRTVTEWMAQDRLDP